MTEDKVAEFLSNNPDFFSRHDDLLADMQLPQKGGQVISLAERQAYVLRDRNVEMRRRLSDLIENARENDLLFDKTKKLVLALLEAGSLREVVDAVYYSFDKDFKIHYTSMVLFIDSSTDCGAARKDTLFNAREYVGKRLKAGKTLSGGLDVKEQEYLFHQDHHNVGSSAISVLSHGQILGLLAIGNQDPNYYRTSMGTLFLSYIAEVLNRVLPKFMPNK